MFLDRFIDFPRNKYLYFITIFGFLLVIIVEMFIFIPIEATVSNYGILDYEFAWTSSRAETILLVWGAHGIKNQIAAIYWDFLFIIGYVSLAFGLIVMIFRKSESKIQTLGAYITITPLLTGSLDIIENIFLILMTVNPTSVPEFFPLIASLSATLKFSFLFIGIAYFLIALLSIIIKKITNQGKESISVKGL